MRNFLKKFFIGLVLLIVLAVIVIYVTGNGYIFTAVSNVYLRGHTTANIYDENTHTVNKVEKGTPFVWEKHEKYNQMLMSEAFLSVSETYKIRGLLVAKDGKLVFEKYWNGHKQDTRSNSFSLAKTITTMLIGAAIDDGYIKSINQPIIDFLPELKDDPTAQKVTVRDLAAMTSGYDWNEHYYNVFNPTTEAYYGKNIEKQMLKRAFIPEKYGKFDYSSGSIQVLGIVLHRAIKRPLAEYLSEKIWKPVGMEYDATWSLDRSEKLEKTYCCVNATLRDFGKFGQLYLDNGAIIRPNAQTGELETKQIISKSFVEDMHSPNTRGFAKDEDVIYGLATWMDVSYDPKFYVMLGHLGQRIIVVPSENLMIVRIGELKDGPAPQVGTVKDRDIYYILEEVREMLAKAGI